MLSFKFVTSAAGAAHYFETADDYYGEEGQRGDWMGQGAAALGLQGGHTVGRDAFQSMLDGQLPDGRLVRRTRTQTSKDRKGIDFTFSAPKSVSIQALVQGDARIVAAHDVAVQKSLQLLESFAAARRKQGGLSFRERTGSLVVATFRHELSRAQDPQLHTHAIVMNLTRRADGEWRALSNEDMLKNVKLVGAHYRATLAAELRVLGLALRETRKGGWELAHIPDAAIRHFSRRSQEIERLLALRGQDRESATTAQKQLVTLATRKKKTENDRAWLHAHWLNTAREAGLGLQSASRQRGVLTRPVDRVGRSTVQDARAADEAVDFAIAHLGERQGIFSRGELLEVAWGRAATRTDTAAVTAALDRAQHDGRLQAELPLYQTARSLNISAAELANDPRASHFKGHDELEKLTRASWIALTMAGRGQTQAQAEASVDGAIRRGALVRAEPRFATPAARHLEMRLLAIEKAGRGKVEPIASAEATQTLLAASPLNLGQREAVAMVLTARDRFVGIQGLAGTGKSHMLAKAVEGIRAEAARLSGAEGYRVIGLAPYASQNHALAALGMTSQTLASFLARKSGHQALDSRSIVFLDEAGVVPTHQLEQLMALVERQQARLVLTGDRQQTHAVEAGKPFEQLQDAGMTKAFLTEILRQKGETLRAAVMHAASNEVPAAVALLRPEVVEVRQDERRHARIARAYVALTEAERAETLIVAGTNVARRAINEQVREKLALTDGQLIEVMQNVDMTRAELRSAQSYETGQLVVPQRRYGANLTQGEAYTVCGHDLTRNNLIVRSGSGNTLTFDPARCPMLRCYEREQIELAPGDWVRVTANDKTLGICNGERYQVASVDAVAVMLRDGERSVRVERKRPVYLQHGYASTVHSAQGMTKDRVLIDADTRSLTSNRAVFYVAISRPRLALTLFTDNSEKLAASMSREPKKFAAMELRDFRNEAAVLQVKTERVARSRLAAQLRRRPSPVRQPASSFRVAR